MSSILKRGLVVAAIVGVGVVPSSAMADHNQPPGKVCTAEAIEEGGFANKGECARTVAKGNGHGPKSGDGE